MFIIIILIIIVSNVCTRNYNGEHIYVMVHGNKVICGPGEGGTRGAQNVRPREGTRGKDMLNSINYYNTTLL